MELSFTKNVATIIWKDQGEGKRPGRFFHNGSPLNVGFFKVNSV